MIDFHPRASEKLCKSHRSLVGFEVSMGAFKEGSKKKCYLVVTKDNTSNKEFKEVCLSLFISYVLRTFPSASAWNVYV